MPPVITRVGMPSVWESTAAKARRALMPRRVLQRLDGVAQDLLLGLVERQPRRADRAAAQADRVHRALEVLDQPGRHVEATERQDALVDVARLGEPARGDVVEQGDALGGRDVRHTRHPPRRADGEALERPVVAPDEHLELRRLEQRGDSAGVAGALLHRHDLRDPAAIAAI